MVTNGFPLGSGTRRGQGRLYTTTFMLLIDTSQFYTFLFQMSVLHWNGCLQEAGGNVRERWARGTTLLSEWITLLSEWITLYGYDFRNKLVFHTLTK